MNQLEVKKLSIAYQGQTVLHRCSLELKRGEVVVVLGASGDGKTSLLKAIAGLLPMQEGEIFFEGTKIKDAVSKLVPGHEKIKLINQDFALDKFHTVEENIRLRLLRFNEEYRHERVQTLLRLTKLSKYRNVKATDLSGGQQQRLAIARALADEPELLLLDEPFNQLDFQNKQVIESHIRNYVRKHGISAILVTHNGIEAMEWADRIVFIQKGRIRRIDTPTDFFNKPANKTEAAFFGELNKLKVKEEDVYFRPGIFSLTKSSACNKKLKIEIQGSLNLGWYTEYTFSFDGQKFKIYSQQALNGIREIFISPIKFND